MAFIRCAKCLRAIEVKGYVALKDGTNFHRECFTCECCHQEMPLKFAFKNGRYFHTECYANLKATSPSCFRCAQGVTPYDEQVILDSYTIHERCFICDTCGQPLQESPITINNQIFHPECIGCMQCNSPLSQVQYQQLPSGEILCNGCLTSRNRMNQTRTVPVYGTQKPNSYSGQYPYPATNPNTNFPRPNLVSASYNTSPSAVQAFKSESDLYGKEAKSKSLPVPSRAPTNGKISTEITSVNTEFGNSSTGENIDNAIEKLETLFKQWGVNNTQSPPTVRQPTGTSFQSGNSQSNLIPTSSSKISHPPVPNARNFSQPKVTPRNQSLEASQLRQSQDSLTAATSMGDLSKTGTREYAAPNLNRSLGELSRAGTREAVNTPPQKSSTTASHGNLMDEIRNMSPNNLRKVQTKSGNTGQITGKPNEMSSALRKALENRRKSNEALEANSDDQELRNKLQERRARIQSGASDSSEWK